MMRLNLLIKSFILTVLFVSSPLWSSDRSFLCTSTSDSTQKLLTVSNNDKKGIIDDISFSLTLKDKKLYGPSDKDSFLIFYSNKLELMSETSRWEGSCLKLSENIASSLKNTDKLANDSSLGSKKTNDETLSTSIISDEFKALPKSKRQHVQAALKHLGFYNSTLDGLWGKGTKLGILEYAKNKDRTSDFGSRSGSEALLKNIMNNLASYKPPSIKPSKNVKKNGTCENSIFKFASKSKNPSNTCKKVLEVCEKLAMKGFIKGKDKFKGGMQGMWSGLNSQVARMNLVNCMSVRGWKKI